LPGGFVGVDIFFVISGYLISNIIHADLDRGSFTISGFYVRRIRRIFPGLLIMMAGVLVVGWCILLPNEFRKLGQHLFGGSTFVSNLFLWHESGYFDGSAETKPLLHLWSLAIEEQYYLGWPILMALTWRFGRRFRLVNAGCIALSFGLNLYCVKYYPTAAYYMPFARFWELFVGAMLAHMNHEGRRFSPGISRITTLVGPAMVLCSLFLIDKTSSFPGWWALLPTMGAFLILGSGNSAWFNRLVLSCRPFVWVGLISYPFYLWHWPLLAFLRIDVGTTPSALARTVAVIASGLLAFATYRWIERPIRFNPSRRIVPGLLSIMLVFSAIGLTLYARFIPPRHHGGDLDKILAASLEWEFPGKMKPLPNQQGLYEFPRSHSEKTLFFGDSHIEHYTPRITRTAEAFPDSANSVLLMTRGGCPPIVGIHKSTDPGCTDAVQQGFDLARRPDVKAVVIGACWNCFLAAPPSEPGADDVYSIDIGGLRHSLADTAGVHLALDKLREELSDLKLRGKRVYLVLDNPVGDRYDPMSFVQGDRLWNFRVSHPADSIEVDELQSSLRRKLITLADELAIPYLDPDPVLCSKTRCLSTLPDGTPIHKDGNHLRAFFVEQHASFLDQTLFAR